MDTKHTPKLLVFTALVLMLALGLQACGVTSAQADSMSITGTWVVTITPAEDTGVPSFVNISSNTKDGLIISSDDLGLVALGVWEKVSGHTYRNTMKGLYEDNGAKMSYQVRAEVTLSADGEQFNGSFVNDIYDPAGNLLFSLPGTVEAERMHVLPLE